MDLVEAVGLTYELIGQEISDAALKSVVQELSRYPAAASLEALARCRRECRKLTLADILDRLPGGYPGAEEAWAIVSSAIGPRGLEREDVSIVWTDEMREAFGVALSLGSDKVAARLAFKEAYAKRVSIARANHQRPCWSVSLGYDPKGREVAVQQALSRSHISQEHAARLLPPGDVVAPDVQALIEALAK